MGGGVSSVSRLRKSLVIRAYNMRRADDTFDDQFRKYAFRKPDGIYYISIQDIRLCLALDSGEYAWVDDLFMHSFGATISDINFLDFMRFLDSGKMPVLTPSRSSSSADLLHTPVAGTSSPASSSDPIKLKGETQSVNKGKIPNRFPPIPPVAAVVTDNNMQISPRRSNQESEVGIAGGGEIDQDEMMHINLSTMTTTSTTLYPESFKLQASKNGDDDETNHCSTTIIIHPSRRNVNGTSLEPFSPTKTAPLWRKREVVKHERTVHYTTIEPDGSQQELVEKETTQTEVLHMESRETGEFAHREITQYEQVETFNGEAVNEVNGQEEYVHLKSLEDEFHYSESNMPRKEQQQPAGPPATMAQEDEEEGEFDKEHREQQERRQQQQHDGDDEHEEADKHSPIRHGDGKDHHTHHAHSHGHGPAPGHTDQEDRYRSAGAHYKLDPEYVAHMEEQDIQVERDRLRRMQDAYMYAANDEEEDGRPMRSDADLAEGSQTVYGETVQFTNTDDVVASTSPSAANTSAPSSARGGSSGGGSSRDTCNRKGGVDDDDLFAPADSGEFVRQRPHQVKATAAAEQQGMSRCTSYESMHDID